jgi:hypothetical protein
MVSIAVSVHPHVVADAITCIASDDLFEIHFSRGRRAAHIAASVGLIILAAFLALTLFAAFRLRIAFDDWWGWPPLACCLLAAIAHRFFTTGFKRAPIRIDRAGRVRCGFQRMRFRTRPTAHLIGPASDDGFFVYRGPLRAKSRVVLVSPGGTRVTLFKTRNELRARYVAQSLGAWLGQSGSPALKADSDVCLARALTVMCATVIFVSLSKQWADHQIFHPVHMGTFALIFTAALTSLLFVMSVRRVWVRWLDLSVMVTVKDRAVQSVVTLLAVFAISATVFHFANLVELRSTPMQPRTSRTVISQVGPSNKTCDVPLYFIEPRLDRLSTFCAANDSRKWEVGQGLLLDERVNAFGVRVVAVRPLEREAGVWGGKDRRTLERCSSR